MKADSKKKTYFGVLRHLNLHYQKSGTLLLKLEDRFLLYKVIRINMIQKLIYVVLH